MEKRKKENKPTLHDPVIQIVVFSIGDEEYGFDITLISEVIRPIKITRLPRMPQFIEGVINFRGAIIPVVDLRKRFELSWTMQNPRTMRMVITRGAIPGTEFGSGKDLLALIVDSAHEVLNLSSRDIEMAPKAATGQYAELITGMGKTGSRLVILLDVTRILSKQEGRELIEAGNAGY
ncbi:MAG: chemotaxis protein CheW [Nitrospirota bacterium]